jgi:hypothetical protein
MALDEKAVVSSWMLRKEMNCNFDGNFREKRLLGRVRRRRVNSSLNFMHIEDI